ncbi:hypothetical protein [Lewinella sp. LCG006]|uniref:hypothetical protein n=1 Tax=Lewinella sp. LCG006 TaxID=3231911 RepID=UPI003460B6EE
MRTTSKTARRIALALWAGVVLFLIHGYFVNNTIDIQMHDTYWVVDTLIVKFLFGIPVALIGVLFWVVIGDD